MGHLPVPALDVPVPQTVEQLPDIAQFFRLLSPDPEQQVIEVPKILPFDVPMRTVLRATQLAEQLVEVPTIISFSMISLLHALLEQRTVEQKVDIPAVGGRGTGGGLSGFLPGQNSSVTAEQIVDIPARPGGAGDLQGGGRQDFQPVQGSAASSSDFPGQAGQGVFRTFPHVRKVRQHLRTRSRNCLRTRAHGLRQLMPCRRSCIATLVVDSGSGMLVMLVFLVMILHALCSLCLSACQSFQASWPACSRRTDCGVLIVDSGSGMSQAGSADISSRAVFLSIVAWPMMLGIMAVMDQKDYCKFYWQWHVQGLVCWPLHLAMCSLNVVGRPRWITGCRKLWILRSCSPFTRSLTSL